MHDSDTHDLARRSVIFTLTAALPIEQNVKLDDDTLYDLADAAAFAQGKSLTDLIAGAVLALEENPDLHVLSIEDPIFPSRLAAAAAAPPALWLLGEPLRLRELLAANSAAILGSRRASAYGREVAYSLAFDLATGGATIVTTMALGIGGAAVNGALNAGSAVVALLPGPATIPYPRSHRLLNDKINADGVTLGLTPPNFAADGVLFDIQRSLAPMLAKKAVLVEGASYADYAADLSQAIAADVAVYAVPGPITSTVSKAPNLFLHHGYAPVLDASDLYDARDTRSALTS